MNSLNMQFYIFIGAVISGGIIGAIPAIAGAVKGKIKLAIGGFFACLFGSIILGMFLSIPFCALFMYLIYKKPKVENKTPVDNFEELTQDKNTVYCSYCGAQIATDDKFCKACGQEQKR